MRCYRSVTSTEYKFHLTELNFNLFQKVTSVVSIYRSVFQPYDVDASLITVCTLADLELKLCMLA